MRKFESPGNLGLDAPPREQSKVALFGHAIASYERRRGPLSRARSGSIANFDWGHLLGILAFAALLRILFFSGALGTDEIVYLTHAQHLLNGDYLHTGYIGGMRDGINGFLAASLWLFGNGVAGAGGLFFACSLGQVALAYSFAHHLWGRQAALWGGLAMATLPLEVTQAGNLNPDPYLGFVIALSVITFYFAERDNRPVLYFASGVFAGWVYWIKQVVVLYGIVFGFLGIANRQLRWNWLWFVVGAFIMVLGQLGLFAVTYGDPLYFFKVNYKFIMETHLLSESTDTSLSRYMVLLFIYIYHVGLVGWLALAACILAIRRMDQPGLRFVLVWGVGLVVIFSAFPISFAPLKFIAKQSNYIDIFLMPLALLAGWFLSQQRRSIALVLGAAMVLCGTVLAALEQQVVRVVTVNGRAAAAFAEAHPGTPVFGPLTAQRQSAVARLLRGSLDAAEDIRPWADLGSLSPGEGPPGDVVAFLIDDPQMQYWPDARRETPIPATLRRCLVPLPPLEPSGLGAGRSVVARLRNALSALPSRYAAAALRATDSFWQVTPAAVYAVTRACAREVHANSAVRPEAPRDA